MSARFRDDEIYSRTELQEMLGGMVELDRFLDRLQIPKRFKNCFLGADILKALHNPPAQSLLKAEADAAHTTAGAAATVPAMKSRPRNSRKAADPLRPINVQDIIRPVDGGKQHE